jgi:4-hydroxybenzoate polyprenyltransferase
MPERSTPRVRALLDATHLEPSLAVTAMATALALRAGRGWGSAWVAAAVLAGQFSVGWANDWIDAGRDVATGRVDKPIVAGLVSRAAVRRAALVALTLTVPLSLASGVVAGVVHVAAVVLAWGYDLGLKATVVSVVPYAGSFALLPTFIALGLPGTPLPHWWVPAAGALLGAGAHFTNALPDLDDDARTGVHGLPQRLGARASLVAAALLLGAGAVVIGFGPPGPLGPAPAVALTIGLGLVAAVPFLSSERRRRRLAFRLTIAAAGMVVLALLLAGSDLAR